MTKLKQRDIPCLRCGKPSKIRGRCMRHYNEGYRNGEFVAGRRLQKDPLKKILRRKLISIEFRCTNPNAKFYNRYGGRGIKNEITLADLYYLWERDKAHLLDCASIDRIDVDGNYHVNNCRFIEFRDQCKTTAPVTVCLSCNNKKKYCINKICPDCIKHRICKKCHEPFERSRKFICKKCRLVTRPCSFCNKPITRDSGSFGSLVRNKKWFCSKAEMGKWIGKRLYRAVT